MPRPPRPKLVTVLAYAAIVIYGAQGLAFFSAVPDKLSGLVFAILFNAPMLPAAVGLLRGCRWAQFLFVAWPICTLGGYWFRLMMAGSPRMTSAEEALIVLAFLLFVASAIILSRRGINRFFHEHVEPR